MRAHAPFSPSSFESRLRVRAQTRLRASGDRIKFQFSENETKTERPMNGMQLANVNYRVEPPRTCTAFPMLHRALHGTRPSSGRPYAARKKLVLKLPIDCFWSRLGGAEICAGVRVSHASELESDSYLRMCVTTLFAYTSHEPNQRKYYKETPSHSGISLMVSLQYMRVHESLRLWELS